MNSPSIKIGSRRIGPGQACFIIAEAGINHNGDIKRALAMVDGAARAGVDAIKFQTFRSELLATAKAPTAQYQRVRSGEGHQRAMLKELELSERAHYQLMERARKRHIIFLSTPFDIGSARMLKKVGVPAFKVSSGDLTNLPFLAELSQLKRPIILSTGMATIQEVKETMKVLRSEKHSSIALLHCVSAYPAMPHEINLRVLRSLGQSFHVPIGFSDHTEGLPIAFAAIALGACILEKHFTLDRGLKGPDHSFSLNPTELAALVRGVRDVEASLGHGVKKPGPREMTMATLSRRSLTAARNLKAGDLIDASSLMALRPGTGLSPRFLPFLLGRRLLRDIPVGTCIQRRWCR